MRALHLIEGQQDWPLPVFPATYLTSILSAKHSVVVGGFGPPRLEGQQLLGRHVYQFHHTTRRSRIELSGRVASFRRSYPRRRPWSSRRLSPANVLTITPVRLPVPGLGSNPTSRSPMSVLSLSYPSQLQLVCLTTLG